jgi:hypothetical protein
MVEASRIALGGFELRAKAEVVAHHPQRFIDHADDLRQSRVWPMWSRIIDLIEARIGRRVA